MYDLRNLSNFFGSVMVIVVEGKRGDLRTLGEAVIDGEGEGFLV